MSRPVAIDLFAGAGGMGLGFEQAGFDVRAAAEIDPVHCVVHAYNFPQCATLPASVADLSADAIRRAAGLGPDDEVDCVFGGPPCQGFSMMGQRALEDPRNRLVLEFVRIVSELRARSFVFENVRGLTVGAHRALLDELVEAFQARGYQVALPWRVLDAADFGVPQRRQRLILLGARAGEALPSYPSPTCAPADRAAHPDLPRGPTCADALRDLPEIEALATLLTGDTARFTPSLPRSAYAAALRAETALGWGAGPRRVWDPELLTASTRTTHSARSRARFHEAAPGTVEPVSRFFKLAPDGLCNTLRAGTDSARGAFTSPRPIHYDAPRCVTVREMARLHGYPDWFRPHATKWHGAREIGNSVPPPLARAVAEQVRRALRCPLTVLDLEIPLGDPRLLTMTSSEAAAHLGVACAIAQRDRRNRAPRVGAP